MHIKVRYKDAGLPYPWRADSRERVVSDGMYFEFGGRGALILFQSNNGGYITNSSSSRGRAEVGVRAVVQQTGFVQLKTLLLRMMMSMRCIGVTITFTTSLIPLIIITIISITLIISRPIDILCIRVALVFRFRGVSVRRGVCPRLLKLSELSLAQFLPHT